MKMSKSWLLAKHFMKNAMLPKSFFLIYLIFILLTVFSAVSGIQNRSEQNQIRQEHQVMARQSWEANPDKHPHRMAHFGTFAFRIGSPLGMFDYGLESFTGSTIFLEAHRQNSVNFSDASFSTGTLRFGELSLALLLQLVLPLILIFIGFSSIAKDRQNGTLKMLITQGATWFELLFGKTIGLFLIALLFFLPVILSTIIALLVVGTLAGGDFGLRLFLLILVYLLFLFVISVGIILVSAKSKTPKNALLRLLGFWLIMVILLPKTGQAMGNYWFPTPTKLAFDSAIEKDVIKKGDSHNPDDPYYNTLRDSVLAVHQVDDVAQLPFNYSGFIMREGEKISSTLYKYHNSQLLDTYQRQNGVSEYLALVNPFMAIKQLSMALAGTDFSSYIDFQNQADNYRYDLAQTMNELQMEYIKPNVNSSEGSVNVIGHEHWEEFNDFEHEPVLLATSISNNFLSVVSILIWPLLMMILLLTTAKKANAL